MKGANFEVHDWVRWAMFLRGIVLLLTIAAIGLTPEKFCNNKFPRALFFSAIVSNLVVEVKELGMFLCTLSGVIFLEYLALVTLPQDSFDCINPYISGAVVHVCVLIVDFDIIIFAASFAEYCENFANYIRNKKR